MHLHEVTTTNDGGMRLTLRGKRERSERGERRDGGEG
jgi:hypothetical protein